MHTGRDTCQQPYLPHMGNMLAMHRKRRKYAYETVVESLHGDGTLAARLKIAMRMRGIKTPSELGDLVKVGRQTAQSWMMGQRVKLTPELAYRLADAVGANARWLILGPPNTPERPIYLSPEELEALHVYNALGDDMGAAWVAQGRELAKLSGKAVKPAPANTTPAATLLPMANSQKHR